MSMKASWLGRRALERIFLILASLILSLLFVRLYQMEQAQFTEVPRRLADGSMVNLNADKPADRMKSLLQDRYYLEDTRDISFATTAIAKGFAELEEPMDNIGELQKSRFNVNAT